MGVKITVQKSSNDMRAIKASIDRALATEMHAVAKDMKEDFEKTASTFKDKPVFEATTTVNPTRITIIVRTGDKVWNWLDNGTSVRHAVMSRDWVSKTKPSIGGGAVVNLSPGPGAGNLAFVSKRINRPGIKARNFTKGIKGTYQRALPRRLQDVLNKAAARSRR